MRKPLMGLVVVLAIIALTYILSYPTTQYIKECERARGVAVKSTDGYTCIDRAYIINKNPAEAGS